MNAKKIIEDDISNLIKKAFIKNIIKNARTKNTFVGGNYVSSPYTFFEHKDDYINQFTNVVDQSKYLFMMTCDESMFQINYEFKINSSKKSYVNKMNLCFLPFVAGNLKMEKDYIRIDYDSNVGSFFHSDAHMHIGFSDHLRIPINEIFLFSEFFNFILYLYYKDIYKEFNSIQSFTHNYPNDNSPRYTKKCVLSKELSSFIYIKN